MRSQAVLCAIAAAAIGMSFTLPTQADAATYPGNKCAADKFKATSSFCKSVLGAESKFVGGGGTDAAKRTDALAKAASKMTAAWGKAESKAADKGVDCVDMTLTDANMQALINGDVATIVSSVTTGLTLSNKDHAKCGSSLLKAASSHCAALLKNEGGYVGKLEKGKGKRDSGNAKSDVKFSSKVTDALVGCPSAATEPTLAAAIDGLAAAVTTNTITSPNVDDTQFTTISPLQYPGQSYEGTQLHPICSFETPYHYFVKRGTVNKVVMYYQGGGACWNALTCGVVGTFDKEVDPNGSDNPNNTTTGFGDLTNSNNPFKDWTIIFVSYCTGDIHFGDATASYNFGGTTYPTYHKGWHNARTAEKWAREHFVAPDEVFVTGSSAGAYGAFFNAPLHHFVWPDSKFTVLADAGNGIITPTFLTQRFPVWNFEAHLPTNIPGVIESIEDGTGIPAYTKAVADFFPNTAWGHYTSSYDGGTGGQTGFYNVMSHDDNNPITAATFWPNWWEASCEWNDLMRAQAISTSAAVPSNYRYYIGTGSRHTMYGSDKVYTDTTGNVPTIVSWVNSMLARDIGWTNVECDSPASCAVLLPGDPRPSPLQAPFETSGPDTIINCP